MKPAKQPNRSASISNRLLYGLAACFLLLNTTGCSTIMDFFVGETEVNAAPATDASRLLVPTPTTEIVLSVAATKPSPTPEPLVEEVATVAPQPVDSAPAALPPAASIAPASPQVVITAPSVNVRTIPGTDGQILRTVPVDTVFELAGQNDGGDWLQVCCIDGAQGWVFGELARVDTPPAAALTATVPASANVAAPTVSRLPGEQLPPAPHPIATLPADATAYNYADYNFAITLPPQWLPIIGGGELIQASMMTVGNENPQIATLLSQQLAQLAQTPLAFMAFSLAPDNVASGYVPSVTILKQPVPTGITLDFFVQFSGSQLEQILGLATPSAASNVQTAAGDALLLTYQMADLNVAAQQYMLMHNNTVYILTFTSALNQADANAATFSAIVDSLTFID